MENLPQNRFSFSKTAVSSPRNSALLNITNMSGTGNFQRSTISTSKSRRQTINGQIEKCKIKTLPNHEQYCMGNNLPVITIFQSIEIERLSVQIETQRIKIKQYERQIFNSSSFQFQIKQLTERCSIYENQINEYRVELEKMNKICQSLYHENQNVKNKLKNTDSVLKNRLEQQNKKNKELTEEVERWKNKYQMIQQNKQNQIEEILGLMQKQRKSMMDRQIKDIQVRHESQIGQLSIQIRKLNELMDTKQRDIEQLTLKNQNSQEYIRQLKQYGYKINQYEDQICILNQQQLRLSRMVDYNTTELDNARKKEFKLSQKLKTDKWLAIDKEHYRQLLEMKQEQIELYHNKIKQLEQKTGQSGQLTHVNSQLSTKVNCLTSEIQKLTKLLKQRSLQIQKWKRTVYDLEQDNIKYRQFEDILIENESKVKVLQAENERVEGVNKVRSRELEQIKNKFINAQNDLINLTRLEKEKKNLQEKNKTQVERIMQLELQIQRLEQDFSTLKQSDNKLKSTQPILSSLKKQNQRLVSKLSQYEKQVNNLKQFENQLGKQSAKIKQSGSTINFYENKLSLMTQQIERLNSMIKVKNEEICRLEDQKLGNFAISNQRKGLQTQLEEKQRIISKLRAENDGYQTKIFNYELKMEQIDNSNKEIFTELNGNLKRMQEQLKRKSKQSEQFRSKQKKMLNQLQEAEQVQKLNQKQHNRITLYLRDIEDLRKQNKQIESNLYDEKRKNQDLQNEVRKVKITINQQEEILRSTSNRNQSRKSTESNRTVISSLTNSVQPQKLLAKINSLQQTINDLKIKYGDLLNFANQNKSSITINSQNSMQSSVRAL